MMMWRGVYWTWGNTFSFIHSTTAILSLQQKIEKPCHGEKLIIENIFTTCKELSINLDVLYEKVDLKTCCIQ